MSLEEDYLMKKVGELESRIAVVESRLDVLDPIPVAEEDGPGSYDEFSKEDLVAEIKRRNESREEADRIPVAGNKPELVERLEADDAKDETQE